MTDSKKYLVGVDIGTTSLKTAIFDTDGNTISSSTVDYTLDTKGSFVEFDGSEYISIVRQSLTEAAQKAFPDCDKEKIAELIAGLSVDTQGETLIVTDESFVPLRPAIVWLDNRADAEAKKIVADFGHEHVYRVTGQPEITATWPACKLMWIRENEPSVFNRIKHVFLLEDWILWALTGKTVTEPTIQSSTIYFDIRKKQWWKEMLDYIGLDSSVFSEIVPSGVRVGAMDAEWFFGGGEAGKGRDGGIPVISGALDQISGAIGAGAVGSGVISEMTGTTMAVFVPASEIPPYNQDSIIPCHINYDGGYALLSWTPTAGIALKWFKNQLCENFSFRELDELAEKAEPGCSGLVFIPYLCGSTMPKYNPDARGVFYGLTMEHTRGHMVRAILESVACMLRSNLEYLGVSCDEIRTMGGGASSPLWCQIKADITGTRLATLKNTETACLGTAILAGTGAGVFESVEAACEKIVRTDKIYIPNRNEKTEDAYLRYVEADEKLYPAGR